MYAYFKYNLRLLAVLELSLAICIDGDSIVKIKLNTGLEKQKSIEARMIYRKTEF